MDMQYHACFLLLIKTKTARGGGSGINGYFSNQPLNPRMSLWALHPAHPELVEGERGNPAGLPGLLLNVIARSEATWQSCAGSSFRSS